MSRIGNGDWHREQITDRQEIWLGNRLEKPVTSHKEVSGRLVDKRSRELGCLELATVEDVVRTNA